MENFDYQGKSKEQYESNEGIMFSGCIGMLVVIIPLIIFEIIL